MATVVFHSYKGSTPLEVDDKYVDRGDIIFTLDVDRLAKLYQTAEGMGVLSFKLYYGFDELSHNLVEDQDEGDLLFASPGEEGQIDNDFCQTAAFVVNIDNLAIIIEHKEFMFRVWNDTIVTLNSDRLFAKIVNMQRL